MVHLARVFGMAASTVAVIITGTGMSGYLSVTIKGTEYYSANTIECDPEETITFTISNTNLIINGVTVVNGAGQWKTYTYDYKLPKSGTVTIDIKGSTENVTVTTS